MAATIRDSRRPGGDAKERKPVLIDRVDGFDGVAEISAAILLPREDGLISASDDKSIRVWLKRETGKYWPSVCHYTESAPTCLFYHAEPRRLFAGLDSGNILEFAVGEDYNKITLIKQYIAHQARVTSVYYSLEHDWVLSTSRDKHFAFHSTDSGRRVGAYNMNAWTLCIAYDTASKHCFVGDNNGNITFLKLTDSGCEFKATLNGHESSVRCLTWDPVKKYLFSGSSDKMIICWDIGGQKGITYDLEGHKDKVSSLIYIPATRQLLSGSEDGKLVAWDMDAKRKENPQWRESDSCEYCKRPFFWNFKAMWEMKTVGLRQHHCRHCGAALCDSCSRARSSIPVLGHEFQVRVCTQCVDKITDAEKTSLATFHDANHSVTYLSYDDTRKYLASVGTDRVIKIWDLSAIVTV